MTPRRDPVPRARSPWSWLAGILTLGILGGGVVAAAILLWENLDIQGLAREGGAAVESVLPVPVAPAGAAAPPGAFRAAVYRSDATAAYFPDEAFYPGALDRWEGLVGRAGGEVSRIASAEEVEALEGEGMVVVPAALCLEEAAVDALHRHAEAGGALVLTGATGARDGACEWRGWESLRDLTGALEARQVEQREGLFLTVPGGLPLSMGLEPASRVEFRGDAQVALAAEGTRIYWSDWALNPAPAEGVEALDAAARLHALGGGGRVAWFGFSGGQGAARLDEERIERLFLNGLRWAAGRPSAELLPWPEGSRAALVVAQQVGWEFENAKHLAALARERGVPVTFFVMSRLARDYPDLAQVLAGAGEVASQTSGDQVVAGFPFAEQQTRLRRSVEEIETWVGKAPRGLRPPAERYDAETLRAWGSLGGSYIVGLSNGRTGSPELFETPEGPVVLLPRVMKDDYNVIVQERGMSQAELVREFTDAAEKLRAIGGLAVMSVHTQVAGSQRRIAALAPVLDSARARGDWWVATAGDVAEWTLARRQAEVRFLSWSGERIELEVAASAGRGLEGAWIEVVLPNGSEGWEPAVEGTRVPYARTEGGLALPVGSVAAGEVRSVVLERAGEEDPGE